MELAINVEKGQCNKKGSQNKKKISKNKKKYKKLVVSTPKEKNYLAHKTTMETTS